MPSKVELYSRKALFSMHRRWQNKVTLRKINRLRKISIIRKLEKKKYLDFVSRIYGEKSNPMS